MYFNKHVGLSKKKKKLIKSWDWRDPPPPSLGQNPKFAQNFFWTAPLSQSNESFHWIRLSMIDECGYFLADSRLSAYCIGSVCRPLLSVYLIRRVKIHGNELSTDGRAASIFYNQPMCQDKSEPDDFFYYSFPCQELYPTPIILP